MSDAVRMDHSKCPYCGHLVDAATSLMEGSIPAPGDITLCLYCTCVCEFDQDMSLMQIPPDKLAQMHPDTLAIVQKAQEIMRRSVIRKSIRDL